MKKAEFDFTKKYGLLSPIMEFKNKHGGRSIQCRCDCGSIVNSSYHALVVGGQESCGCKQYADMRTNNKTHGLSGGWKGKRDKFYQTRYGIKQRTTNPCKRSSCLTYSHIKNNKSEFFSFPASRVSGGFCPMGNLLLKKEAKIYCNWKIKM